LHKFAELHARLAARRRNENICVLSVSCSSRRREFPRRPSPAEREIIPSRDSQVRLVGIRVTRSMIDSRDGLAIEFPTDKNLEAISSEIVRRSLPSTFRSAFRDRVRKRKHNERANFLRKECRLCRLSRGREKWRSPRGFDIKALDVNETKKFRLRTVVR